MQLDEDFLRALEYACTHRGMGMGVDRLLSVFTGRASGRPSCSVIKPSDLKPRSNGQ